jgi:RNA polymerase sporulation-specific sigma factor
MRYEDINDEQLICMLHESSEDAKDLLFEKYKYIIDIEIRKYMSMASMLGYDYNDLYQDALVGFSEALNCYREDKAAALSSFITLCVDRKLQVSIIKAGRLKNKLISDSLSLDYQYDQFTSPLRDIISDNSLNDPLENIIKNEKLSNLTKKIEDSLSSSEYEVYALMISGLKYGEIALLLNKNPKQVDNTIQRVKHKIKNIIEDK